MKPSMAVTLRTTPPSMAPPRAKNLATSEVSTFRKSVTKPEELGLAFPIGGVGPHHLEVRLPRRLPSISVVICRDFRG